MQQHLMGHTKSDSCSVGNKFWKSSDGETWTMTFDHIKPTTALSPFTTYFCDVEFRKKRTNNSNRSLQGDTNKPRRTKYQTEAKNSKMMFLPEENN